MRPSTIPEELEPIVLKWFLEGQSYWTISERLDAEHQIDTTAASVHRAIDRIARSAAYNGVVRTVGKLRAEAPRLAEKLQHQLAIAEKMAGLDSPVEVPAGMTPKMLEFLNKLTLRELKAAGCSGREAERALESGRGTVEEHFLAEDEFVEDELARLRASRTIETPVMTRTSAPSNGQVPAPPKVPFVAPEKQGRNEQCACGSSLKFKKCCGMAPVRARPPVEAHALAG